jgi:hypothetical protein
VLKELMEYREQPEQPETRVFREPLALRELQEHKVFRGLKVFKEFKVFRERQD